MVKNLPNWLWELSYVVESYCGRDSSRYAEWKWLPHKYRIAIIIITIMIILLCFCTCDLNHSNGSCKTNSMLLKSKERHRQNFLSWKTKYLIAWNWLTAKIRFFPSSNWNFCEREERNVVVIVETDTKMKAWLMLSSLVKDAAVHRINGIHHAFNRSSSKLLRRISSIFRCMRWSGVDSSWGYLKDSHLELRRKIRQILWAVWDINWKLVDKAFS